MDSWHNHLTNMIALHSRGKHMEEALNFTSLVGKELSPADLMKKLTRAEEIKKLYVKAHRMCQLLQETQDEDSAINLKYTAHNIESGLRRINDVIKMLDFKAKKWGLSEEDISPPTVRTPPEMLADFNAVQDNPYADMYDFAPESQRSSSDPDSIKEEVKSALKALMDVVDYMETPTLLKIRKRLDKLVEY